MSPRIQRAVEFLGEEPLAARLRASGAILDQVAARLDDDDIQLRRLRAMRRPRAFASTCSACASARGLPRVPILSRAGRALAAENQELPNSSCGYR